MAVLAGGIGAFILGIIGLVIWWNQFLTLLAGAVPAILILGGGLAAYLGYDELKEKKREETPKPETTELKQKIESLEKELKELKEKREKEEQAESQKE